MKFRTLFTLLALLLATGLSAQTTAERAGKRAKNRAENRAQNNADRKVDRAVDDAFNAVSNLFKKKKKAKKEDPARAKSDAKANAKVKDGGAAPNNGEEYENDEEVMNALNNMMGGKSEPWEAYTNPVSFSVRMEMTEEKKNGKTEDTSMDMSATTDRFGIRMRGLDGQEETRMILNTQDGKTTMITTDKEGATTGYRMQMPGVKRITEQRTEDALDGITIEETNETRAIDGYHCRKFVVTDSKRGTVTDSWVTKDAGLNAQDVFSGMMNAFGAQVKKQQGGPGTALAGGYDGFPILSVSRDGKSTYTMRFRDLKIGEANMDRAVLDTSGVEIQSVGF